MVSWASGATAFWAASNWRSRVRTASSWVRRRAHVDVAPPELCERRSGRLGKPPVPPPSPWWRRRCPLSSDRRGQSHPLIVGHGAEQAVGCGGGEGVAAHPRCQREEEADLDS
jgi:hypothetical protein